MQLFVRNKYTCFYMIEPEAPRSVNLNFMWSFSSAAKHQPFQKLIIHKKLAPTKLNDSTVKSN